MPKNSTNTRVMLTLVAFIAVLLAIIFTRISISRARHEIVDVFAPSRFLVGALHGLVAQSHSEFVAYSLTGSPTYLDRYHLTSQRMEEALSGVSDLLPNSLKAPGAPYSELEKSLTEWRGSIQSSLRPPSPKLSLEDLYAIENSATDVHRTASLLEDNIEMELDHQRRRIENLETANIIALAGIAVLGLVLAIKALRTNKQLEQALMSRNEVLRTVSHDLRNPLTPIRVAATFLQSEEGAPPASRHYAHMIARSVDTMNRMIEDLLEAARAESGVALPLEFHRVAMHELMDQIFESWRVVAEQRRITLRKELHPCIADVDQRRIAEAVSNLIANALKFTPPGGEVRMECRRTGSDAAITVADNGPGMSEAEIETLFKPFWHKPKSGASGTGLGLFIVKRTVEDHGGRILVTSEPGAGTTVSFTIPLKQLREA